MEVEGMLLLSPRMLAAGPTFGELLEETGVPEQPTLLPVLLPSCRIRFRRHFARAF
jgi:hypothetical protein